MKSTGECLGIAESFNEALYKAFLGAGINLPKHKNMIMTVRDEDKEEAVEIGKRFEALGYRIYATRNTAKTLQEAGVKAIRTNKLEQPSPNLIIRFWVTRSIWSSIHLLRVWNTQKTVS